MGFIRVTPNNKPSAILVKLIELIRYFLTICLYSEISLSKRNNLFARIAILNDKVVSVS